MSNPSSLQSFNLSAQGETFPDSVNAKLNAISIGIVVASLLFAALSADLSEGQRLRANCGLIMAVAGLAALLAQHRKHAVLALRILIYGSLLSVTLVAVFGQGVHTPILASYPVAVIIVTWLFGLGEGSYVFFICLAAVGSMGLAQHTGHLAENTPFPPLMVTLTLVTALTIAAAFSALLWKLFSENMAREKQLNAEIRQHLDAVETSKNMLIEQEYRWRYAIEGCGDGFWDWDSTVGTLRLSPSWKAALGFGEHQIDTSVEQWMSLLHPDDSVAHISAIKAYVDRETEFFASDIRLRCSSGEYKWFRVRGAALRYSMGGEPQHMVGTYTDITEQKANRERLDEALRFQEAVLNIARYAVVTTSVTGVIEHLSEEAEVQLGYRPAEAVGRLHAWRFIAPEMLVSSPTVEADWVDSDLASSFEALFGDEDPALTYRSEMMLVRKDGSQFPALVSRGALHHADGSLRGYIGVAIDISDSKQKEVQLEVARRQAERANLAKSKFLAAVSHDLRQPISALSLYANVLKKKVAPSEFALVDTIRDCLDMVVGLLDNLLEIGKLGAGGVSPVVTEFAVADLLSKLEAACAVEAHAKDLTLRVRQSAEVVRSDAVLLQRVLGNLVVNAIRYTRKGGVLVGVRRQGGGLWVEVWDTGIGISPENLVMIFQEFRRIEGTGGDGSGLGLAIVAETAALLGLRIRVKSRPGRGSMFAIGIPVAGDAAGATRRLPKAVAE